MAYREFIKDVLRPITPMPVRYFVRKVLNSGLRGLSPAEYWTRHNVTEHERFASAEDSLAQLRWRNSQYPGYIELMPVNQAQGKAVLDFGCGPGNDLVGFATASAPQRLIGADVSTSSLVEAKNRLKLHDFERVEFIHLGASETLPFKDRSIDLIHCSGVLHHLPNMSQVLGEFRRLISETGYCQIMVYNHHSIWMQLYAAYIYKRMFPWKASLPKRDVFKITTDGEECPIVNSYSAEEFCRIAADAGFRAQFTGSAISLNEMIWLPQRFEALKDRTLDPEAREFLSSLTFDDRGVPLYRGHVAGVDACFRLSPA